VADDHRKDEYEMGYGKPPQNRQFQKGRSGNSKGRPKGSKNLTTVVGEALSERVVISENGRRRRATKVDVIGRQLVNKAAKGDYRSIQLLISFAEKHPVLNTDTTAEERAEPNEAIVPMFQAALETLIACGATPRNYDLEHHRGSDGVALRELENMLPKDSLKDAGETKR
jgi:hypothetical protein